MKISLTTYKNFEAFLSTVMQMKGELGFTPLLDTVAEKLGYSKSGFISPTVTKMRSLGMISEGRWNSETKVLRDDRLEKFLKSKNVDFSDSLKTYLERKKKSK